MVSFLFRPGKINTLELKNRIVMAPMGARGLIELDGRFSQRAVDYYVARARGGAGLIITGLMAIETEVEKRDRGPWSPLARADSTLYIPRLNELAEAVQDHGAKIAAQLTAGYGRLARPEVVQAGWAVAPSAQPCSSDPSVLARELTIEEIVKLTKAFVAAALIVKQAGFDAIELHGHEGYLIDQFMTAKWNKRKDGYGGDLEGRLRFPLEIIASVRRAVGGQFPLIFRMAGRHHVEDGRHIEESIAIARKFEEAGVDCLHIDAGCSEAKHWAHPPVYMDRGCTVDCASSIKKRVTIPVIAVGRLGYPDLAERVLAEGEADFIALGRALLADPEWPIKVKKNAISAIRPCIGDYDGCLGRIVAGKTLSCSVNPQTGMEREFSIKPASDKKSLLVVGSGPAGMEAARVAALRGHRVVLWEKEPHLGGNLIPASTPSFKADVKTLISYFSHQMESLNVRVVLNKEATPDQVLKEHVDEVVIATGARPAIPKLRGLEKICFSDAVDLLKGREAPGDSAVVLGGGLVGCETALWLSKTGKEVVIVESLPHLMVGIFSITKHALSQLLFEAGVRIMTSTTVLEIVEDGVLARSPEGVQQIRTSFLVAATGFEPDRRLLDGLQDASFPVHAIGDCVKPRNIQHAIWEGFRLSLRI
ncbi:MAG: FAD-dependent oxidoreductase [Desulfobacterota bacterium]|jgi:2-enoate reductase|nr:FAD-dependent oxidoreductase [Thermodesulfobacteriota bacterium]